MSVQLIEQRNEQVTRASEVIVRKSERLNERDMNGVRIEYNFLTNSCVLTDGL